MRYSPPPPMSFRLKLLKYADREPVVAFSIAMCGIAFVLPAVVVPLRRGLGLSTLEHSGGAVLPPALPTSKEVGTASE